MDSDTQETLPQDDGTNRILEAIGDLRREMNERFGKIESELQTMKHLQLSFDVRLDRLQAMAQETLQIAYSVRAEVKILRRKGTSWSKDVTDLQRKVA